MHTRDGNSKPAEVTDVVSQHEAFLGPLGCQPPLATLDAAIGPRPTPRATSGAVGAERRQAAKRREDDGGEGEARKEYNQSGYTDTRPDHIRPDRQGQDHMNARRSTSESDKHSEVRGEHSELIDLIVNIAKSPVQQTQQWSTVAPQTGNK